jgi:hypothetical protein
MFKGVWLKMCQGLAHYQFLESPGSGSQKTNVFYCGLGAVDVCVSVRAHVYARDCMDMCTYRSLSGNLSMYDMCSFISDLGSGRNNNNSFIVETTICYT